MTEYDNRNSGIAFKNDRKQKPSQPDLTGYWTDANNKEHYMSVWRKTKEDGTVYFTFAARPKEPKPQQDQGHVERPLDTYGDKDPFDF